ncbi:MAG: hypothetical protein ACREBC_31015, partial [Pyrinomonadaceae bacterium]
MQDGRRQSETYPQITQIRKARKQEQDADGRNTELVILAVLLLLPSAVCLLLLLFRNLRNLRDSPSLAFSPSQPANCRQLLLRHQLAFVIK